MNREIIFRGKRNDNHEWLEGFYVKQKGRGVDGREDCYIHHIVDEHGTWQEVDPKTICQYIFTNNEGDRVFEHDFVNNDGFNPSLYEVVFARGTFCLKFEIDAGYWLDIKYAEKGRVVGNKFDNPELCPKSM